MASDDDIDFDDVRGGQIIVDAKTPLPTSTTPPDLPPAPRDEPGDSNAGGAERNITR